jgi:hypothetical protein
MKQINVWFEDNEHKAFADEKKESSKNWHDFLIDLLLFWKKNKEVEE